MLPRAYYRAMPGHRSQANNIRKSSPREYLAVLTHLRSTLRRWFTGVGAIGLALGFVMPHEASRGRAIVNTQPPDGHQVNANTQPNTRKKIADAFRTPPNPLALALPPCSLPLSIPFLTLTATWSFDKCRASYSGTTQAMLLMRRHAIASTTPTSIHWKCCTPSAFSTMNTSRPGSMRRIIPSAAASGRL